MMNKDLLVEFNTAIDKVMQIIEKGEEIRARFIFNSEVYPTYSKDIDNDTLSFAVPF